MDMSQPNFYVIAIFVGALAVLGSIAFAFQGHLEF